MKRAVKVIFLLGWTFSFAQTANELSFQFSSSDYSKIGKKVTGLNQDVWGVFLGDAADDSRAKLVIDESGIYFLNNAMQKSVVVYDTSNTESVLYQDQGKYWLFAKSTEADKLFTFYEIAVVRKPGMTPSGYISPMVMTADKLTDFLEECKNEGIKVKAKDNVVALDSLNPILFHYYRPSAQKISVNIDPAFDVVIESPQCSAGKEQKWLDTAQYDVLKLNSALTDQRGKPVDEFLVIDKSGIFTFAEGKKDQPHYLYKIGDANYAFQKTANGYLTFQKLASGHYDMVVIMPKGKLVQLFELKRESHAFFSLSKNKVINGVVTYFICNELEKYLLYGKAGKGDYTGSKFHW